MKILVLGDQHFGSGSLGRTDPTTQLNSRLIDFSNTFNSIVDEAIKRGVKVMVLTGDAVEDRVPQPSHINALSKCITRATKLGLEIVMCVGNHDQTRNIDTSTVDFLSHLEVPSVSVFPQVGIKTYNEGDKQFHLVLLPYRDRRMLNAETNEKAIEIIKTQLSDLVKNLQGNKILVGHLMLEANNNEEDNPDSFSINELKLPINTFEGLNAVFMGHIHKHEIIQESDPLVIYTGSMDRVSFSERNHQKVSIVLDTDTLEYEIIPTKTRAVIEMNFDYSVGEELHKETINAQIFKDIDEFCKETDIKEAIVKLVIGVKEADQFHISHNKLKDKMLEKGIHNLLPITINTTGQRQLRNAEITEDTDEIKAIGSFINTLSEPDELKKKLKKYAEEIIENN